MKIVVYEHFTSGAMSGQDLPVELAAEGDAMLQAMVADMLYHTAFQPVIMRDHRLPLVADIINISVNDSGQYQQIWQHCLDNEALFLLIAPETGGVLQQLAEQVLAAGKTLLGCTPDAIDLCSDKLRCNHFLQQYDLPVIPSQSALQWLAQPAFSTPLICKPRDGAGCVATYRFTENSMANAHLKNVSTQPAQQIVQPFVSGEAMSLSVFVDGAKRQILSLNQQMLDVQNSQLNYQGSIVAVPYPANFSQIEAQQLLDKLCEALPGLWGFAGIDLIVSPTTVVIVDINPRLTTSFNQLVTATGISAAKLLYQAIAKQSPARLYG